MKIFKSYTYTWWQVGIFKLALLSMGAIAGSYWHEFFESNRFLFLVVVIVTGGYIWYISLRDKR